MKQGILALVDNFEQPPGPSRYPVIAISDLLHLSTTQNTDTTFWQSCIIEIIIGAKLTGTRAPFW